jgi:2-oxoisovalerate dehydrogenase E1 component
MSGAPHPDLVKATATRSALSKAGTRSANRAQIVDQNFLAALRELRSFVARPLEADEGVHAGTRLTACQFRELFDAQMRSRHLDLVAREMRARNEGFYTIGSSGHEANAVLGYLTRVTDPAFLHYRSGAFMMARTAKLKGCDPLYDTALSLSASREDPISGGRHKVWGSRDAWVLPQTSTIASHLSKAFGTAVALEQARRLQRPLPVPADSIVVCSFGDASANHSAALGAFNAAQWTAHQGLPVPVLFVCEDNGIGISVRTPRGWIESNFGARPGMHYLRANGCNLVDAFERAAEAISFCREQRRPVFLHVEHPRLLAHAGTDVETEYRPLDEVEADESRDPLIASAMLAVELGVMSAEEVLERYESIRAAARSAAQRAAQTPKLARTDEVIAPLAPYSPKEVQTEATRTPDPAARIRAFGGEAQLPERAPPRHLSLQINRALFDLMVKYPQMTLFGEDVAQKGGVYTVTSGLAAAFRAPRVFNTLLDETTILGLAQGAGYMGLLPVPEIQYLAYFHNACDQIRGEAASLQFFSNGQFRNPMVMRIAALGYQKGFGGHFHNDNSFTALRDIPGLVIACPSRGDDAAAMLRTCMALAHVDGRVVAYLEPIALYMSKDLYEPKDNQWLFEYPAPDRAIPLGEGRVYGPGQPKSACDLLIVTFGNGVPMSLRAARALERGTGKRTRILDLRWLKPLNGEWIAAHAREVGKVLVVDEGRRTGGLGEEIFTAIDEHAGPGILKRRVTGADTYIPLGAAANLVLPSDADVLEAARELLSAAG